MSAERDVYEEITQTIIKAIGQGAGDFQMPWLRGGMRPTKPSPIHLTGLLMS